MAAKYSKTDLELKLDECITSALDSLLKNYPGSDEFLAVYQDKMFIKPNTKAFIHVTHYLFTVLDDKEFKKRFYWPIKCKTDESHFRTATVEYINHLIDLGKLKMDKIKAMHVVIPGGVKFMKFLLKVIVLVVNEVLVRKNATNIEVKKPVGEYICKDLLEKKEFVTEMGVELKKIIASDIAEIKKKTEMIDEAIEKAFISVPEMGEEEKKNLFDGWSKLNLEKFMKIQAEQNKMRELINSFARICKDGQNLLKSQEFTPNRYNSVEIRDSIKIVKDKLGYADESETTLVSYGNIDVIEIIKLIKHSIEHVVAMISQSPLRDLKDVKADAAIVKDLYTRTISVSSELKTFMKKLSDGGDLQKTEISSQTIVRDSELLHGFFGTPPISVNTKESEDLSMINMPFGRVGVIDTSKINLSQSRLLQISQRELHFSPRLERSVLGSLNVINKPPRAKKRQFQINSAALFGSRDTQKVNVSRLESYSMVMPGTANVFSSTVLEQTVRNQTPPSIGINNVSKLSSVPTSSGGSSDLSISLLHETKIQRNLQEIKPKQTPKKFLTPQPKRLSVNTILSPKIQVNDETVTSPSLFKSTNSLINLSKSSSPSDRIKSRPGRPSLASLSTDSDSGYCLTKRLSQMKDTKDEESPTTQDFFSKFDKFNICEEKENLFDTSETLLVNDSI